MDNHPGTVPARAHGQHPRRPPAHRSVSLRHSPPAKRQRAASTVAARPSRQSTTLSTSPNAPASDKANPPSSVSPRLHVNNPSSGESSDAAGWFERTNNDATHDASFVDNDPPFLLHNSSSSERTPPDGHQTAMPTLPYRPNLMNLGTDGSSTEDFRSVIDDLTIANKKLKQRLRKYEKVYDAHLQEEKLFEVRFHGLPDHKKKELEETLRKFAAGLDDSSERPEVSLVPTLNKEVTHSSTSRFAESGYVSMSASGQNSSTPSNGASNQNVDNRKMTKSAYNRQQQSIQSYLHDIPLGLLPQDNAHMSDKARNKMVVRRLEQIFAGKRSAPGTHPQPMQQEEVAQSAATADRREREANGRSSRPEGQRTALIMPERADTEGEQMGAYLNIPAQQRINEQDFAVSGSGSPDQRPTRPLDLDPYRAQVPAANMEYFRHLGFSPPDMISTSETQEGHGWLYLNLLFNMAQLHTLNVTPDNVKDAIAQYSAKLELSNDGRKVRWKGGHDFSKNSSDGSPEGRLGISSPYQAPGAQRSPQKSSKTGNSSNESGYGGSEQPHSRSIANAKPFVEANKFAYKPLFFRRESSEEDADLYDPNESASSLFQPQHGDSSGLGSSNLQSNISGKRRDDGPMIFYNKARFCTDLTGDRVGASLTLPENYKTITSHPLGAHLNTEPSNETDFWEPRGPLDDAKMDVDTKSGTGTPSTLETLGFSPDNLQNNLGSESVDVMDFEASGLGGVQPDDNFSIRVQRSQIRTDGLGNQAARRPSLYPSKIQAILVEDGPSQTVARRSTSPKNTIQEKVISAVRKDMPNSVLPPPSFFPFDSASSGEVSDDEESSDGGSDTGDGPSTALQLLNIVPPGPSPASNETDDDSSEASEYSEDSDDGSIDLLATARQQDPDTVRAFEREYDAAVADRFAEEIVAGSSAATAGGGSGFNSPASNAGEASSLSKQGSRRSARNAQSSNSEASMSPRSKNLKRARAGESIATVMKHGAKASKSQRTE